MKRISFSPRSRPPGPADAPKRLSKLVSRTALDLVVPVVNKTVEVNAQITSSPQCRAPRRARVLRVSGQRRERMLEDDGLSTRPLSTD